MTPLIKVKEIISTNAVVVFSKTYCPYCKRAKNLLTELGASYIVVELNVETDGPEMQDALQEHTGQRTVPNIFIKEKHIGGCDSIIEIHKNGLLLPMLTDAGVIATVAA
ncbi:Glutaredoxin-C4, chloroplastic [Zostera marina]|uniref:Glutaredoxin-C4, chloroplastic n=1 Tax=Zostera marina TaxID=29655 RepID=A0A0K9PIZ0_ZOSMR|nr:Glutaredoxin-C4, chloroplastic [Zostera marina]